MSPVIEIVTYLVIGKQRVYPYFAVKRATKKQPALEPGERAVRVVIKTDRKFFEPAGTPTATIDIPEDMLSTPVPDVEVLPYEALE